MRESVLVVGFVLAVLVLVLVAVAVAVAVVVSLLFLLLLLVAAFSPAVFSVQLRFFEFCRNRVHTPYLSA
jgi:hypothetical protein